MSLLRHGLLAGRGIAACGIGPGVCDKLSALGARVELIDVAALPSEEGQVGDWARARTPLHAIVFAAAPAIGEGFQAALEQAWVTVREVAVGALIPCEVATKVVIIAPPGGPACAGLENLARTLSVEWARYRITTVTIVPRGRVEDAQLAELVGFLCSRAGEYLSGCRLDFGESSPSG